MAGFEPATFVIADAALPKYPYSAPPARYLLIVLVAVVIVLDDSDGCLSKAGAGFEPDRFRLVCRHANRQLLHLLPRWLVPVVVSVAVVDPERHHDIGVDGIAHGHHLRLTVARHDLRV